VSWGNLSTQGRWAWWWKDQIDRGFVGSFAQAPAAQPMPAQSAPGRDAAP